MTDHSKNGFIKVWMEEEKKQAIIVYDICNYCNINRDLSGKGST
ncbi:MAG TPA: hypothetical protein PLY78_08875 [Methanospirillum sp.]|nr:hypothetical protein [Methanospirillum sp.]